MPDDDQADHADKATRTRWTILGIGAAGLVIGVGAAVWLLLLSGDAEASTKGRCAGSAYELSAERDDEDDRVSASLEVLTDTPGEQWSVELTSNGRSVLDRTVTTDDEAEVDVDAFLGRGDADRSVAARFGPEGGDTCTARVRLG